MIRDVFDSDSDEELPIQFQVNENTEIIVFAYLEPNFIAPYILILKLGLGLEFSTTCSQETKETNLLQLLHSCRT